MTTSEPTKGEGEYGVKFNEPTTGEIVRALRNCADATAKKKPCTPECYYFNRTECCAGSLYDNAADRLESQAKENEISRHLIEMQSNVITELTARAENAEAAITEIEEGFYGNGNALCNLCENGNLAKCHHTHDFMGCGFKYDRRGLPQDGEGKI